MPLLRGRECSGDSVATPAILSGVPTKLRVLPEGEQSLLAASAISWGGAQARGSWQEAPDKMPAKAGQAAGQRPNEALPVSDQHHEGDPRGGGGGESPADAARRPHPPPRGGALQLAADGPEGAAEGGTDHPRGDEPRRSVRAGDARDPAGGAVAGVGPLEGVRAGAAAHQGPARARFRGRT